MESSEALAVTLNLYSVVLRGWLTPFTMALRGGGRREKEKKGEEEGKGERKGEEGKGRDRKRRKGIGESGGH